MTELINILDETAEQFGVVKTRGNVTVFVTQSLDAFGNARFEYSITFKSEAYHLSVTASDEAITTNLTPEIVETLIKELA